MKLYLAFLDHENCSCMQVWSVTAQRSTPQITWYLCHCRASGRTLPRHTIHTKSKMRFVHCGAALSSKHAGLLLLDLARPVHSWVHDQVQLPEHNWSCAVLAWWQKYDKNTPSAFRFWRPAWKLGNSIDTKFQGSEPEWPLWAVGAICTARPSEVSPLTALWGLWCLNDNSGGNSSSPSRKWNDYQIHINMTVRCVYCTCRLYCPIPPSTSTQYIQYTLHNDKASILKHGPCFPGALLFRIGTVQISSWYSFISCNQPTQQHDIVEPRAPQPLGLCSNSASCNAKGSAWTQVSRQGKL